MTCSGLAPITPMTGPIGMDHNPLIEQRLVEPAADAKEADKALLIHMLHQ